MDNDNNDKTKISLEKIEIGETKLEIGDDANPGAPLKENYSNNASNENSDEKPWNYKILLLLKKIGKKTMGYRWMHEQDTKYYTAKNNRFNMYERLILAFLATITGGGFVSFIAGVDLTENRTVFIVLSIIELVTVFFAAIVKEYRYVNDYEKYKNDHSMAAVKNAEINLEIQYQLALDVNQRETDKYFLANIIKKFNDILYEAPKIRAETKDKYLEGSEDNEMFNPIITDNGMLQVVVHDAKDTDKTNINNDSRMKYQIDRWLQHF